MGLCNFSFSVWLHTSSLLCFSVFYSSWGQPWSYGFLYPLEKVSFWPRRQLGTAAFFSRVFISLFWRWIFFREEPGSITYILFSYYVVFLLPPLCVCLSESASRCPVLHAHCFDAFHCRFIQNKWVLTRWMHFSLGWQISHFSAFEWSPFLSLLSDM